MSRNCKTTYYTRTHVKVALYFNYTCKVFTSNLYGIINLMYIIVMRGTLLYIQEHKIFDLKQSNKQTSIEKYYYHM